MNDPRAFNERPYKILYLVHYGDAMLTIKNKGGYVFEKNLF